MRTVAKRLLRCGKAMGRVGEDVSDRQEIDPSEFIGHCHAHGKCARCCHTHEWLLQERARMSDGGGIAVAVDYRSRR